MIFTEVLNVRTYADTYNHSCAIHYILKCIFKMCEFIVCVVKRIGTVVFDINIM